MTQIHNKAELLEKITRARDELEETLGGLEDLRLETPETVDCWSVKDVMAHLIGWERRLVKWLEAGLQGQEPQLPEPGVSWKEMAALNQRDYLEWREVPLAQVRAEFDASFQAVQRALGAAGEEDLMEAGRFAWMSGRAFASLVAACTFEHYQEHVEAIRSWLKL